LCSIRYSDLARISGWLFSHDFYSDSSMAYMGLQRQVASQAWVEGFLESSFFISMN
jgi:hypothetical protein